MMKIIYVLLGIVLLAFVASQLYGLYIQNGIETYPYTLSKKYDAFEIRDYEASLFTSVTLSTSEYKEAGSKGFSILGGYIFGKNASNEKIAMTTPVSMSIEDSITMMFMVPKTIKKEKLPKPNASSIVFKESPAKKLAAITFSGWASKEKIENYKQKLIVALEAEGISHTQRFYFFAYNSPYEFFNRRNEVVVEL